MVRHAELGLLLGEEPVGTILFGSTLTPVMKMDGGYWIRIETGVTFSVPRVADAMVACERYGYPWAFS